MPRDRRPAARHAEDGNTLLLMPAAVMIVLVMGAVALDSAIVFLGERQASNLATALANDAAGVLDDPAYYGLGAEHPGGEVVVDEDRARALVAGRIPVHSTDRFRITSWRLALPSPTEVEIEIVAEVPVLFSPALSGGATRTVDAAARARATTGRG